MIEETRTFLAVTTFSGNGGIWCWTWRYLGYMKLCPQPALWYGLTFAKEAALILGKLAHVLIYIFSSCILFLLFLTGINGRKNNHYLIHVSWRCILLSTIGISTSFLKRHFKKLCAFLCCKKNVEVVDRFVCWAVTK